MSRKQTLAEEQAEARADRANILRPQLARVGLRAALIAAADEAPWHKFAYKIHNAARRIRA